MAITCACLLIGLVDVDAGAQPNAAPIPSTVPTAPEPTEEVRDPASGSTPHPAATTTAPPPRPADATVPATEEELGTAAPPAVPRLPVTEYPFFVAGKPTTLGPPGLRVLRGALMIPLRPVARGLLADLQIDPVNRTIRIIRADDQREFIVDGKTSTLWSSGVSEGMRDDIAQVDWTPDQEAVPQTLIERLFNVFVAIDPERQQISVNPLSAAFAEAISSYQQEEKAGTIRSSDAPRFRLNAVQYDSQINSNNVTRTGQITTFRANAQYGRTVINPYFTFMGSTKGPGWFPAQGGVQIRPRKWDIHLGDFLLSTNSLFANGLNRGAIIERVYGGASRVGLEVGALQSRLKMVGLQVQRPLFLRNNGIFYFYLDTTDFKNKPFFKTPFWTNNKFTVGGGAGGFYDRKNPIFNSKGGTSYLYVTNDISRLGGRIKGHTELTVGASAAVENKAISDKYRPGGIVLFRNNLTVFNKLTISTLLQRGSEHWATLDLSNAYRNQFALTNAIQFRILNGLSVYGQRTISKPVRGGDLNTIYAGGGNMDLLPGILPSVSFNTNISNTPGTRSQYFNTLFFEQPLRPLRSAISGSWLTNNSGTDGQFNSVLSLNTRTTWFRGVRTSAYRQWSTPETTNTQFQLDSGRLLGRNLVLYAGFGRTISPMVVTRNVNFGGSVSIPKVNQRASVNFTKFGENYQVLITMNGFVGRRGVELATGTVPQVTVIPTGTVVGRFYLDNNMSGTYEPGVDTPMPDLKVYGSNRLLTQTDLEGRYIAKNMPRGFVSVTTDPTSIPATLAFLTPATQDVFILPNRSRVVDFRFGRFGQLRGSISSEDVPAQQLQDIRVFVAGTDRDTLSDDLGQFRLVDLVPGSVSIKIDPEYLPEGIEVVKGEATVILKPGEKLSGVELTVRQRKKEVIEKRF